MAIGNHKAYNYDCRHDSNRDGEFLKRNLTNFTQDITEGSIVSLVGRTRFPLEDFESHQHMHAGARKSKHHQRHRKQHNRNHHQHSQCTVSCRQNGLHILKELEELTVFRKILERHASGKGVVARKPEVQSIGRHL